MARSIVVIGCKNPASAERMRQHYGLKTIMADGHELARRLSLGQQLVTDDVLYLANKVPPVHAMNGALLISHSDAMEQCEAAAYAVDAAVADCEA